MGEKLNGGLGAFLCDCCSRIMWVGLNGRNDPKRRLFIYSTKAEDVVQVGDRIFCSRRCAAEGARPADAEPPKEIL